jgi:alkylation response protein AidB-like acyl-CoA dehydrogenase
MADQPTLDEFRHEATSFLDAHLERRATDDGPFRWGVGSDRVAVFDEIDPDEEQRALAAAKAWRATRFDAGFAWITGPVAHGGGGLPAPYEQAYLELERRYRVPDQSFFGVGLAMVAPTVAAHGDEAVQAELLPKLHRGDLIGCQLFSEPGAGSDLASLQTRAVRDGDGWVVTGQKVWTSNAQFSDVGEIICRTDPDQPKHRGLTAFVVDMHAPGVEVRPLRQMTGGASFNEVFLEEVHVPDRWRLGEVGGGWAVALTTLMNERAAIGGGMGGGMGTASGGRSMVARLTELCRQLGVLDDPVVRDRLADVIIRFRVAQLTNQRAMDAMRAGQAPGPELSIAKLALTANLWQAVNVVVDLLGPRAAADTGEWGTYAWTQLLLGLPGLRIAGGSDEVLRNVIGERVLGLPKDPGIDNRTPFRDLAVGTQAG